MDVIRSWGSFIGAIIPLETQSNDATPAFQIDKFAISSTVHDCTTAYVNGSHQCLLSVSWVDYR